MGEDYHFREAAKLPPGPRGLPLIGSLLSVRNNPHLAIHRIAQQYGDMCMLRFGNVPTVVISHPGLLREAFDKAELSDRWVSEINDILSHHGNDLVLAPYGEHWRQLQRFANRELLSRRNLEQIRHHHVLDVVNRLVDEVGEKSDSGMPVQPIEVLSRSNAMIMFRSIFGLNEDHFAADFVATERAAGRTGPGGWCAAPVWPSRCTSWWPVDLVLRMSISPPTCPRLA